MSAKRLKRVWTDAEKASAIALLARNGGNMKRTVREFRTTDGAEIAESTLRSFRDNPGTDHRGRRGLVRPVQSIAKGTLMKLAVGMNRDEWVNRQLAAEGTTATVSLGILYDKVALEKGRATEIVDSPFGQLLTELRDMRSRERRAKPLELIEGKKDKQSA